MLQQLTIWPLAVGARDLRCQHQVQCTSKRYRQFSALGDDPQFRLRRRLPAGWYMLEVLLNLPVPSCAGHLYYDTGRGDSEEHHYRLPVQSGRMAKRLIHLPAAARVRFDPCQSEGAFAVQHFRLVRMTRRAALQRIHRKVAGRPLGPREAVEQDDDALWSTYNRLFAELATDSAPCYAAWIAERETPAIPTPELQQALMSTWHWQPTFSIILPVYNTPAEHLRACLDSVLAQSYPHWQLCIADDASTLPHVREILEEYQRREPRIRINFRDTNGHIAHASNSALALAEGDFVALLDHDDTLAAHALFSVAEALQQRPSAQLVYSDEDKLDAEGNRCHPYFKPDYSPDLLYSQNYFSHLGVYRRDLVERIGGFRPGFEGSQDYDLVLRCLSQVASPQDVLHVPRVLYHWRQTVGSTSTGHDSKDYAALAAQRALQEHFDTNAPGVETVAIEPGLYRHRWPLPEPRPLVSLIVPTRDGHDVLKTCIESILDKTSYDSFEILVVDNQSACPRTLRYVAELDRRSDIRVLRYDRPFNYSAINNFAAREARGSILGLINNDVEVISAEWLEEMVRHAVRTDIGCVGAKLYYPDGTLQHAGVVLGIGGVAGHSHKYVPGDARGYFSRLRIVHNVSAVTGAALVVRKDVYDEVGGLDEVGLKVAFNDVDFCLKCAQAGYRNLWTPFAELYHHESKTRGTDCSAQRQARFQSECELIARRWGDLLQQDPCYNPNLSLTREDYSLSAISRGDSRGHR